MVTALNCTIKRCSSASGDEGLSGGGEGGGWGGGGRSGLFTQEGNKAGAS